jgi:excisionase family DNA binding protein
METLIDITELERITSIKVETLRKKVAHKEIPFVKIGRLVRFSPGEIERWVEGCTVRETEPSYGHDGAQGLLEL